MLSFLSASTLIASAPSAYWQTCLIMLVLAYIVGSVSFAVIVSAAFRLADPRTYGSKNPGATNVLRSGHTVAAALTLAGDACKGALAVVLMRIWATQAGWGELYSALAIGLVGYAVFLGHLYPLFFRFRGGKGVATAAGVLWAFHPLLGMSVSLTWLGMAAVFRYSSLAALISALLAPIYALYWLGWGDGAWPLVISTGVLSALLIYKHRCNIHQLLRKQEQRIGSSRKTGS